MRNNHRLTAPASLLLILSWGGGLHAAAPPPSPAQAPSQTQTAQAPSHTRTPVPAQGRMQPVANLQQLMIGMLYPASNVVFAAQDDLSTFKQAEDAASSPNPLTSIYNGWQAVQDAALSLSEASNLLLLPGRSCSNGQPVPLGRPDWAPFVQVLREASADAYKAAQSQSQDAMLTVSDTLTRACDACHKAYRDKYPNTGNRKVCMP